MLTNQAPDKKRCAPKFPAHVSIVMDGNGRWAEHKGISRLEGHRKGVQSVRRMVRTCAELKIPYLTLFAFSSENWKRPPKEVEWLMRLLSNALDREIFTLQKNNIKLQFIGNFSELPSSIETKIYEAIERTRENTGLVLTVAINYGGQWDLTEATRKIATKVANKQLAVSDITADLIANHLSTENLPEPDLFIRTGGEMRMSNFLLWQHAYTELYFTKVFWPDFSQKEFAKALEAYSSRIRRFGGIKTQH